MLENSIDIAKHWYETAKDAQDRLIDKMKFKSPFSIRFKRWPGALKYNHENDYTMRQGSTSCWIHIDGNLIYVRRVAHGAAVEILQMSDDGKLIKKTECAHTKEATYRTKEEPTSEF